MDFNNPILRKIAFSRAKGIHAGTTCELLERIGSLDNFFNYSRAELSNISGLNNQIFDESYRSEILENAMKECQFVETNRIDASFIADSDYPQRLKQCDDAPVLIYKLGSCNLDSAHMVAVVGTRHSTPYGVDFTTKLVEQLSKKIDNLVIVSGLAYGIDVAAHKAALANNVPTVAVVAHGLNTIYPAPHRAIASRIVSSGGAIVTEYTTDDKIMRNNFLERNRIVAGLCDCVVVVESDIHGGSMSTARIALQYNREVFAVPGRVTDTYSRGTNHLISVNVANILTDTDTLIEHMGWTPKVTEEIPQPSLFYALTPVQQEIADYIRQNPEATVNEICVRLNMSFAVLSDNLFQMEMNDVVKAMPGGRYALTF